MQKLTVFLFTAFLIAIISACSNEVPGTAYVIKGDGSVTKAAARDVYLLPFDSVEDLSERFDGFIGEDICRLYPDKQQEKINSLNDSLKEYSASCESERSSIPPLNDGEDVTLTNFESQFEQYSSDISAKANELAKSVKLSADALYEKEKSKIRFNYSIDGDIGDYQRLEYEIHNGSNYAFASTPTSDKYGLIITLSAIYADKVLLESNQFISATRYDNLIEDIETPKWVSQGDFPPGETYKKKILVRTLNWSFVKDEINEGIRSGQLKQCGVDPIFEDRLVPCIDKVILTGYGFYENSRVVYKPIDFVQITKESDPKVIRAQKEIDEMSMNLANTRDLFSTYASCKSLEDDLALISKAKCPLANSNTSIKAFVSEMNTNLRLGLPELKDASYTKERFLAFAKTNAVQQTVTNVDGDFLFSEVASGNYVVYSEYEDSFNNLLWLKPIKADGSKIELSNRNASEKLPF